MTVLIINPRCAVVALRPDLVLVLWCVWGPTGLVPGQVDVHFNAPGAFLHWSARFARASNSR